MSGAEWYAFTTNKDGIHVSITGRRLAYCSNYEENGSDVIRGAVANIHNIDGGIAGAWHENGVSYSIRFRCDEPTDSRCADKSRLDSYASGLTYVGGSAAVGAP